MRRLAGRRASLVPLLFAALLLWPIGGAAAQTRIATIIIRGLQHVERERLLEDLHVHEGDTFHTGLDSELERRARHLPYLRALRAQIQEGATGVHLSLRVREASRVRFYPVFRVIEDGELAAGFDIESEALLGRDEIWRGTLMVGARTEARLALHDLRLAASPWLPGLNYEFAVWDWDNAFLDAETRKIWHLGGLSWRLPSAGRVRFLGGWESVQTTPPRGLDPLGEDAQPLYRATLRQPLGSPDWVLSAWTELRAPEATRDYALGAAQLDARRRQGKWILRALAASGFANNWNPVKDIFFIDSWRYLRGYPAGDLPAREFHFLRLRADLPLFALPVRMNRFTDAEDVIFGPYLLVEGARLRLDRSGSFTDAADYGCGLSAVIPGRVPMRLSGGVQWNRDGDATTIFLIEVD
ncbi:MAG: hypothetical protein JW819_01305 [Candidatus Krumholzibacteriota bacterium]|nr:hypothetical protein [Candidatus Krumholzibacteriota bacterium]